MEGSYGTGARPRWGARPGALRGDGGISGDGGRAVPGPGRDAPELLDDRIRDGLDRGEGLARFMGLFSLGLGLAEVLAPDAMARLVGAEPSRTTRNTMRSMGAREIVSGIGVLANPDPAQWMQARIAGDALDLALLGKAMAGDRKERTTLALLAVIGAAAADVVATVRLRSSEEARELATPHEPIRGISLHRSLTILRPVEEVYAFWRDFTNLPRFMRHLESVELLGDGLSRWKARAPAGLAASWDAEITEERPNELIAWRSLPGSIVQNAGVVRFRSAPGDRGTELHVRLTYDPPGGRITKALAMLFREEPGQQVKDDLRRFKSMMETGEVVVSDATVERGPHPARPPRNAEEGS